MQIPFIGGAYKGRSTDVNAQECINLFPELDNQQAKNVIALYGTPGMEDFSDEPDVATLTFSGTVTYSGP